MIYSYVRVSTEKQEFLRQDYNIEEWCKEHDITVDKQFSDKASGKTFDREEYLKLKDVVQTGDSVIIKELDRLGRDWDGIKEEWKWFSDNGVNVIVIDMPLLAETIYDKDGKVDLSKKLIQNLILETMCYSAEIERRKVSRRTSEALQAKKAQGMILGRPKNDEKNKNIMKLVKAGVPMKEISYQMKTSRAQIYRVMKEYGYQRA